MTAAARAAGMSRESAHRLRGRRDGTLFAYLWDQALAAAPRPRESHDVPLSDGQLARLLGNHYRRESGDFLSVGAARAKPPRGNRT